MLPARSGQFECAAFRIECANAAVGYYTAHEGDRYRVAGNGLLQQGNPLRCHGEGQFVVVPARQLQCVALLRLYSIQQRRRGRQARGIDFYSDSAGCGHVTEIGEQPIRYVDATAGELAQQDAQVDARLGRSRRARS